MHPYVDKKASEGSPKVSRYILQVSTSKKRPHLGLSVIELVSQGRAAHPTLLPGSPRGLWDGWVWCKDVSELSVFLLQAGTTSGS